MVSITITTLHEVVVLYIARLKYTLCSLDNSEIKTIPILILTFSEYVRTSVNYGHLHSSNIA